MTVQERNYWLTTVDMPRTDAAQPLPESVDVAVIGAGFTGLSAARTLAKRGAKVVVLEAETIGWGASSRNGGMVLTGLKLGANKLISKYGRERTQRMYAASLASIDCVEQIVREEGIDCHFYRCGHLEVACKQRHFDDYSRQVEVIAREFNHQLRSVGQARLARYNFSWCSLGPRCVRRNQWLHGIGDSVTAKKNHSHRVIHHYHGGFARSCGAGIEPAQSHDLRFQKLSLLLSAHSR
jgi:hypothetical protein